MKSDYYVKTHGIVLEHKEQDYVIYALNKEEAELQAKQMFGNDYTVINDSVELQTKKQNTLLYVISVFCLLVSVILAYVQWSVESSFLWFDRSEIYVIAPNLETTIYAIVFYSAFFVRFKGMESVFKSVKDIIVAILIILVFASMFTIVLGSQTFLGGIITISPRTLIFIGLFLSWGGMKLVSSGCYILFAIFTIENITNVSEAMGTIWGPMYILLAYVGIAIYISSDYSLRNSLSSMLNFSKKAATYVSNDLKAAKAELDELRSKK